MQTVSAELVREQQLPDQRYYRHVELLKRYWNGSEYVWEAATNIDEYIVSVSTAKWTRDQRGFSEWKSPSFQIEVNNPRNVWNDVEVASIWNTGLNSGYITELSKIRVRVGHILEDETEQDLYVFGGVIKQPLAFHKGKKKNTATIYCGGLDELLRRVSAEALSTTVTNELLGSDAGTDFTTNFNGVARFTSVKKGQTVDGAAAATELTPSTDYNTSDENQISTPATVALEAALIAGQSVWASYFYWYQDKEPSWIVEQLLDIVGIVDYTVEPTIFATAVENTWTQTTTADFDAGTLLQGVSTYSDSLRGPVLIDDFNDGETTTNPAWVRTADYSITVTGGKLSIQNGDDLYTLFTGAYGTWEAKLSASGTNPFNFCFLRTSSGGAYSIYLTNGFIALIKDNDLSGGILAFAGLGYSTERTYRITRTTGGLFTVYVDGVSTLTATDNSYTTCERIRIESWTNSAQSVTVDDIMWSPEVTAAGALTTGIFESQVKDTLLGQIASWGKLLTNYGLNGGTLSIQTYTSSSSTFASGNDPAGWVSLSGTGQILSAVLRYIKVRVTIVRGSAPQQTPEFQDFSVKYYTSSTRIPLVNLTGQDVLSVIRDIAGFAAYEFGFTAAEEFFYRSRSTATAPVLVINKDNYLKEELSYNKGTDKVFTAVEANFGEFTETIDAITEEEASPNALDKYGRIPISVSSTLLPGPSVNVARSAAQTLYAYVSVPRDRAQLELKMLVQLELGDVITYEREHDNGRWLWGDPDRVWGGQGDEEDFEFYADPDENGWNIDMRIEGIEFITDPKKPALRYDLVRNI